LLFLQSLHWIVAQILFYQLPSFVVRHDAVLLQVLGVGDIFKTVRAVVVTGSNNNFTATTLVQKRLKILRTHLPQCVLPASTKVASCPNWDAHLQSHPAAAAANCIRFPRQKVCSMSKATSTISTPRGFVVFYLGICALGQLSKTAAAVVKGGREGLHLCGLGVR
jgi:hypothetical protein